VSFIDQIKKAKSNVVRRLFIKRRNIATGLFEDGWLEITEDVKRFGKIKKAVDSTRPYKFKLNSLQFEVANTNGRYNPHDDENSLWYGYLNQQRTLVKLECAFLDIDDTSKEYKVLSEVPETSVWDNSYYDSEGAVWDAPGSIIFKGILSGDINISDSNNVVFDVRPLTSVFEDFSYSNLSGFTTTGITASQYIGILRDQTDAYGNYVFRPFFDNTVSTWNYSTTSFVYSNLNTSSSLETVDSTCWEVIEKLAEAENYVPYVSGDGTFNFVSRSSVESVASYEFHGAGSFSPTYGNTIKKISGFGYKMSKYYSRVRIKFKDQDTLTSYVTTEAAFEVGPASNPWILGDRSLDIENTFFGTSTFAQTAADNLFTEVSSLKKELTFETSLILGLDIFDRFKVYYDPTTVNTRSLWDLNNWADATNSDDHLIWDRTDGEQIRLNGQEFKFLSFETDLDNLRCNFLAREL